MKEEAREKLRRRANRISGQIAGIQRMIDQNRIASIFCIKSRQSDPRWTP
jgi:hypothetical protein